jgi:hypothetical protein
MRGAVLEMMTAMLRLLCGALVLAPALACDSAIIIPRMRGDSGDTDAMPDTGMMDSGMIDPLRCLMGQLPPRPPTADGDDGVEYTFVFVQWELFPPSPDFGFNLDERCTTSAATASCTSDGLVTDESLGVDNAFASRISSQARSYFTTIGEDPQGDLWNLQNKGIMDLLIRVRGWNGLDDDRMVEVDFMQTVCGHLSSEPDCTPGMDRPTGLTFDGSDTFYVSTASISTTDPDAARVVQTAAYVVNGTLVAPIPDESSLRFPVEDGYIDVGLQDAQLTAPLPDPGRGFTIESAMISGRWSLANFEETLAYFALCPADGDPRTTLITSAIQGALDIRDEPSDDNMELPCNAISAAIRMTGYRGTYGGAKDQVRLPRGCP